MRATKEIAHLDQTAEDMKQTIAALNDECQSLKEEKKLTQEEAKTKEAIIIPRTFQSRQNDLTR